MDDRQGQKAVKGITRVNWNTEVSLVCAVCGYVVTTAKMHLTQYAERHAMETGHQTFTVAHGGTVEVA